MPLLLYNDMFRSNPLEMFLGKDVLKICSKFTREYSCGSVISMMLLYKFIDIALWHERSHVNLQYNLRIPLYKNVYRGLLLNANKHAAR